MRIARIANLSPENNLNNLMNFKSKNINPENLRVNIHGVETSYAEYWRAQYNGNNIEANAPNYDASRIKNFNQLNIARLTDKNISASTIYIDYKAINGNSNIEAQILYLFKELYNIFGKEGANHNGGVIFGSQNHFIDRFDPNNVLGCINQVGITSLKKSLEGLLCLRRVDDGMKDLVTTSIKAGTYEQCADGFIESIEGAYNKSTSDSQVSQMKLDALEVYINNLVQSHGPGGPFDLPNSRGLAYIVHDVKAMLKKFVLDFKLPEVHVADWNTPLANRIADKIKKAHPFIKNNIKQIPDQIIEDFSNSYVDDDVQVLSTIFEQFAEHKTNYYPYDKCLNASLDNYAITPNTLEKLKFFLKVNMAGSGFIDNLAYKFTHNYKNFLYVKGYAIDAVNNLRESLNSGVIVDKDVDDEITIMSPESFRDQNAGFNIAQIEFTELFATRIREASIREYYDQPFLNNILTQRFAGCTEQELRNAFRNEPGAQAIYDLIPILIIKYTNNHNYRSV